MPNFRLLRIIHLLCYCAPPNYFVYCKSTNYFTTENSLNICLLCKEKLCDNFNPPIWKLFDYLYCYCVKPNFLATAHHTNILLLHISQLFVCFKSTKYFTTGNRLNNCLRCKKELYDIFKSAIFKHFNDLYGYKAKPIFFSLLCIIKLFSYCAFPHYLSTANRQIISQREIV